MIKHIFFVLAIAGATFTSCENHSEAMKQLAETTVKSSLQVPGSYKLIGISEPDSSFGYRYMSVKEVAGIVATMQRVTDKIMQKTDSLTNVDNADPTSMELAERQMQASSTVSAILHGMTHKKNKWSGWKIKIDYSAKTVSGQDYNAEKWLFIGKDGKTVFKTFEIPLP